MILIVPLKKIRPLCISLIFILVDFIHLYAQVITTVAGNGLQGYSGNGGQALLSENRGPWGTVVDRSGNIYFADPDNNVISKIDANGIITRWAGTGVGGFSGDGGPASQAQLLNPSFLTSDDSGNLFFVDDQNTRVRKIDTNGIVTTVAGNGLFGYSGDGGPAIAASFNLIFGASPDNKGSLYISDLQNSVIRKVDISGNITTIAGTGVSGFSGDNGPAKSAQLNFPFQVAIDKSGNIYIPDEGNKRIRKIDNSGIITTIAGNGTFGYSGDGGPAILSQVGVIYQVQIDASGQIFLADQGNHVIRKIDCAGIITTYAGTGTAGFDGDGGPATSADLQYPLNVGTDVTGNIYISDHLNYRIRKVTNTPIFLNNSQPTMNKVCLGTSATFTCNYLSANTFQWQILNGNTWISLIDNSQYSGSATNVLTVIGPTSSFSGSQYRCVIASSCNFYISNTDTLLVSGGNISIDISTPSDSICAGTNAIFSANIKANQTDLIYSWKLNGIKTGTNSPIYSTNLLLNNDMISCTLIDTSTCSSIVTMESNTIKMHVTDSLMTTLTISSQGNPSCFGAPINFLATATNEGSNPKFVWEVNGSSNGFGSSHFESDSLLNGDIISCMLISGMSCTAPAHSNNISTIIYPLFKVDAGRDTTISLGKFVQLTPMITGDVLNFQWSPALGLDDPFRMDPIASPLISTTYRLIGVDNNGCESIDSVKINVYSKLSMPNAFPPDGNGVNDVFRIPPKTPITIKSFSIFDRWGVRVFETSDANKGWDGKFNSNPQEIGTYVWVISYLDPISNQSMQDSGTVTLVR